MQTTLATALYLKALKCEDMCAELKPCSDEVLFYLSVVLAVLTVIFASFSVLFYCFYKKERNLRMTMWNVKTEDLRLDKMQWSSLEVQKQLELDVIDEKSQMGNKRTKPRYTTTGSYKGRLVAVQKYRTRRMSLEKRNLMADLDQVFMINHEHVCKFYGANQTGAYITVLTEYCTRGSLHDLLENQSACDDVFKNSLIFDIVKGMLYLHQTAIGSHGNLKPSNCLIDSRFMVKITDFGIIGQRFKLKQNRCHETSRDLARKKLWTAPELLRAVSPPQEGTKKGDVYSFAVIAQEILYQRGVYYRKSDNYSPDEILQRVITPDEEDKEVFRPTLQDVDDIVIRDQWRKTLKRCWAEKPRERFDFQEIFQVAMGLQTENTLIDSLLQRLQIYSNRLEEKVEEKTEQYKAEKEKSDTLLYQMLPKTVANRLKVNMDVMPEFYNQVTVFFSDIVGFSEICHKIQPLQVVQMLNDLYTMFDKIIDEFDVYKVETIGDAYMVVSGLPIRNGDSHAREIARMALRLRDSVCNDFHIRHMPDETLKLRVGIHTGPVVAGVVGLKMPRYCLFGDTVNTAARMEQSGKELQIHVSSHTKEVLDGFGIFNLKKRKHSVTLKGLGEWHTWWLIGEKDPNIFEDPTTDPDLNPINRSLSSSTSSLSESVILSDSSTGYNTDPTFEVENDECKTKATIIQNDQLSKSKQAFENPTEIESIPISPCTNTSYYTDVEDSKNSYRRYSEKSESIRININLESCTTVL